MRRPSHSERTEAESRALADYKVVVGKIVTVKMLTAYNRNDDTVDFDGIDCKVLVTETPVEDLCHWVDDYLDPYWNVEPVNIESLSEHGELRSWWTFGPSYRVVDGRVVAVDSQATESEESQ